MFTVGQNISPEQARELAFVEAKRGVGWVSPNPPVGAVIVDKDHNFLSSGYHKQCGADHAEVDALNNLKNRELLEKATMYVTLEPCSHEGRTPSCAQALSKLPIKKVVYGVSDPTELAGRGANILRAAGIDTILDHNWTSLCTELTQVFFCNVKEKRAFINLKVAASLDGMLALKNGESQWITGADARLHARTRRAHFDATLVGAETIRQDNPKLDFRETDFKKKENKVVVIDPKGELVRSRSFDIFSLHKEVFIITDKKNATTDNHVIGMEKLPDGRFDLQVLAEDLLSRGVTSIYVEGGAKVFSSFLNQGVFDQIELYQGLHIIGGKSGKLWTEEFAIDSLDQKILLSKVETYSVGDDQFSRFFKKS